MNELRVIRGRQTNRTPHHGRLEIGTEQAIITGSSDVRI